MGVVMNIPFITTAQMVEVDRAMIEDYGITLLQMMENAGRGLATLARRRFLGGNPCGKRVIVLAGTGGNGGGGLVCARRLHGWGAQVSVHLSKSPAVYSGVPMHQLSIVGRLPVPVVTGLDAADWSSADLIIDALIGYSLKGAPRGLTADLIRSANGSLVPILALDTPSGLDTTTGMVYAPAIRAAATLTLVLPKIGLKAGRENVGDLYLADISVPPELYVGPGLELAVGPIFAQDDIIAVEW
ncbi:NAD(P)H-hydrate epimerase [Chloroflexota bacterium]